jgi:hypothetical protein
VQLIFSAGAIPLRSHHVTHEHQPRFLLRQVDFELQKMHTYFIVEQDSAGNSVLSDVDFTRKMVLGRGGSYEEGMVV